MSSSCWEPGQAVTSDTPLDKLLLCLGVLGESSEYQLIISKLVTRSCTTVGDLETWTYGELKMLLNTLQLPRNYRAYMSAISSATGLTFSEVATAVQARGQGSNWHLNCTKKEISAEFNPSTFTPDGRCYAHLPRKGCAAYIEKEAEQLYVDLLWLELQVHPEPAVGEYLPIGLKRRLRKIHNDNFPPFKPFNVGKVNERGRDAGDVIITRFQNPRNGHVYKRMVIDEVYKSVFVGKVATSVVFVPSGSDDLLHNTRNNALITFLQVYKGEVQVCTMSRATCMHVAPTSCAA